MSCDTEIDKFLKATHTKVLLNYINHLKAFDHYYECNKPNQWLYPELSSEVTVFNLKSNLSTGDYILNKLEAKTVRKQKSKEHKRR